MTTALVTGASSGIGLALARVIARNGHDVVAVARREAALQALAEELTAHWGVRALAISADLGTAAGLEHVADRLRAEGVQPDLLVNNAGVGVWGPFADTPIERDVAMLRLNVEGLVRLTKHLLPGMLARGRGRIANLSSTAAFQPGPGMAVYYASKAFVQWWSEALAHELAGSGVTVTAVCPGPTPTGFQAAAGLGSPRRLQRFMVLPAERVAEVAYRGIMAGRRVVVPGALNRLGVLAARLAPRTLVAAVVAAINRSGAAAPPARDG